MTLSESCQFLAVVFRIKLLLEVYWKCYSRQIVRNQLTKFHKMSIPLSAQYCRCLWCSNVRSFTRWEDNVEFINSILWKNAIKFISILTYIWFLFSIYGSGQVLWVASAHMRQGCVISERAHHRITGFSHSISVTSRPEKCSLISVLVLLNADWLKVLAVTNSMLTCIAMREMEGMMLQREPPAIINSYNTFSNQMSGLKELIKHPLPSTPQATLMDSMLELEQLVPGINIQRLQIYYNEFMPDVDPPVVCPRTGLPPQGTSASVTCSCLANSVATSDLQLTCHSDGTCTGNPTCQCWGGYGLQEERCEGTSHSAEIILELTN